MKKLFTILISISIIFCLLVSVNADTSNISPLWDNTHGVSGAIYFSEAAGNTGTYAARIIGYADVTNIYATAILYYKDSNGNWIEKHPWAGMTNSNALIIDKDFTGESGVEYKVELTGYVYVGTYCETVYHTATRTCP